MDLVRIAAVFFKDLTDAVKSRTLVIFLLTPLLLALFFAMTASHGPLAHPVGIWDADGSGLGDLLLEHGVVVKKVTAAREAIRLVEEKKVAAAILVPSGIFNHGSRSIRKPARLSGRVSEVEPGGARVMIVHSPSGEASLLVPSLREMIRDFAGFEALLPFKTLKVGEERAGGGIGIWVVLASMAGLLVTSASLVEEKERRTMQALRVTPLAPLELVAGKCGVGTLLAAGSAGFIVLLLSAFVPYLAMGGEATREASQVFWFSQLLKSSGWLLLFLLLSALFFSLLGVLVASCSPNQATASGLHSLLYFLFFLPLPLASISPFAFTVEKFLPSYYILSGLNRLVEGGGVGIEVVILAGACALIGLMGMRALAYSAIRS